MAAIANFHKLEGLKQQEFFSLRFWRPEVWTQCHMAVEPHFPHGLWWRLFLVSSGLCGSLGSNRWSLCSYFTSPSPLLSVQLSLCLSLSWTLVDGFRAHLDNPGESPHIKILNLIESAKISLLLWENIYRFQGKGPEDIGWLLTR